MTSAGGAVHRATVTFADVIFLARAETGTSVEELADLAGVPPAAVDAFERGEAVPTPNVAISIAGVLALNIAELLDLAYGTD